MLDCLISIGRIHISSSLNKKLVTMSISPITNIGVDLILGDFYLVDEIQGTYRGMMIAIPSPHWKSFRMTSLTQMALLLQHLAAKVNLKRFLKTTRGAKKKR